MKQIICHMVILLGLLFPSSLLLAIEPINTGIDDNIAIKGYDPVAYFTLNKPTQGNTLHTAQYEGATWLFSSEEHKKSFTENPQRYMPQFGGYCAFAAAKNRVVKVDPELFLIHENKLYLSFNKGVMRKFEKKIDKYLTKANHNWPKLLEND